ncbi:MAG: histidine phosphatase family protein [Minwuia sp.]|uniref:histidine phosphatase family protein n=1 Tax=Minwuia sp. TaxID=2493630 RepID=UPI003A84A3D1
MIRHGRTGWNAERRIQGRTDVPLSPEGRAEQAARRIPAAFAQAPAYSSPLARAVETARLLGLDPVTDARLTEMDFGDWEGRTHAELTAEDADGMARLEARGINMRPPGGETPREVQTRLVEFLRSKDGGDLIAVCHKGVIRAAFALALDWDMTADMPFRVRWNEGQLFRFDDGRLSLEQANLSLSAA